ncbi:hypothetical protein [Oceanobacillus manasiensis]|uniref:hypothetical protein n=1 Tax=Oceanobacillus manasiensis TaxID=586413 RepID=UPI001E32123F|nr:hypothetical protein [Oceanobacillus manasiensis]
MSKSKDKMTNQDIAEIYGVKYQKIQQLIRKHKLNTNELRKVDKQIVYEHWYKGKVVYVGSGKWNRMTSSSRRNLEHKKLMQDGLIKYKIVKEFNDVQYVREYENKLITRYRSLGKADFNLKYDGVREEISNRGYTSTTESNNKDKPILVWKNGSYFGTYNRIIDFASEVSDQPKKLLSCISLIIHRNWRPMQGNLGGYVIKFKDNS